MFTSFKKLFRKDTGSDLATSIPEMAAPVPATRAPAIPGRPPAGSFVSEARTPVPTLSPSANAADIVTLPVQSVLARLPNSLAGIVQSQGNGSFSLPAQWIVQELPKGSVKIPFGQLRQIAPLGTFFDNPRHDQVLVELPLDEILNRLPPSLLERRKEQKQILLPAEITNIFGPRGEGIQLSTAMASRPAKPAATPTPSARFTQAEEPVAMPRFEKPLTIERAEPNISEVPAPIRVLPTETAPAANGGTERFERLIVPLSALSASWPEMIGRELASLNLTAVVIAFPMEQLAQGLKTGKLVFNWKQIRQWIQPMVSNSAVADETLIELPLKVIAPLFMARHQPKAQKKIFIGDMPDLFAGTSETVPEQPPVQMAAPIAQTAPIKIPVVMEPAAPIAPIAPVSSAPDPVAPRISIAEKVSAPPAPNLSVEQQAPISMPTPVIAPVATPKSIGEIFGQPSKTTWSPTEIVKSLIAMPGVAGAFVAMQDGLLVAAELPSHLKAETVAAFLPQIFGRMNQYAKELQLGALSDLSFVAENVPWRIIKSKTVYLVAIGKSGENLPGSHLNTIAAELGQKIQ